MSEKGFSEFLYRPYSEPKESPLLVFSNPEPLKLFWARYTSVRGWGVFAPPFLVSTQRSDVKVRLEGQFFFVVFTHFLIYPQNPEYFEYKHIGSKKNP